MVNKVPLVIADFETSLASAISAGATSFTLASATDDDGNALAAGKYCFTLNNGSSNKQYLIGQLNGTAVTSVVYVDRRGNETSGAQYAARAGAPVIISDFATIQRVADILRGQVDLDGDNPITYDAEPTLANREELATVGYVLDQVSGGTVNFDNQIISSSDATAGETISAGNLVFFQTSDQEWYQADADTAAEVENVAMGIALGSGTDGASISGGVQVSGVYTTTGLTAGDTYYASNTAGAITNSAGTNKRAIGVALSATKLLLTPIYPDTPTSDQKDALAGASNAPTSSNKFVTADDLADPTFKAPVVEVFTSSNTWTKDAGLKYVVVEVVGGGGTGGNATDNSLGAGGGGGGGGGYSRKKILASALSATETVTVGAAASTSSFGAHVSATGGSNGVAEGAGGAGGVGSGGDINVAGGGGGSGHGGIGAGSGAGGNSVLGGGGAGRFTTGAGNAGGAYGGGGGGAWDSSNSTQTGGAGAAGVVIVTEYYS